MSEVNEALIRRFLEVYNDRAWDRLGEVLAADYVHHSNADSLTAAQFIRSATVALSGITIFRIADGWIAEDWEVMDEGDLRRQISAPEASG